MTIYNDIKVCPVKMEDKRYSDKVFKMINTAFRSSESWTRDSAVVGVDRISKEGLNELIDNGGKDRLLYAFDNKNVIGSILIKEDGLLSMLAVSPDYQSRGIGGLLVRESIAYMKLVLHMKLAKVYVFQCRPELLSWYQRIGFEDNGEIIPFPDKSILIVDEAPLVILKYRII